jgi:hypothetical protein
MSIITDNSTPLPLNSPQNLQMINTVNTNMQSFINSNMLSNVSNLLINNINTKQPTLTAATNLLGVGSAITAIDWTKITLNKPTDFQANWNTTIINKPSTFPADMTNIYSKTETNGLLDAKQPTLTAATTLLGTGGSITAIDYNKITVNKPTNFQSDYINTVINKPTYVSPLSSNLATNQISVNLTSYSTTGNDANYVLKSGSTMTGTLTAPIINATSTTTASDFKGIYIMHAARQSHIPYIPDGKFYFRAPVIIDNPADFLSFGSRTGDFIIKLFGEDYGFGINGYTLRYNAAASASHKFYTGSTNTFTINGDGNISTLGTITEAGTLLTSKYLQLSGGTLTGTLNGTTINATTALQEAGTNLTSKYLQLAGGSMTANANITLSGTGTFTGIHSGNGAALTNLPLSAYSTTGTDPNFLLKSGGTMTGLLSATTINTTGNVGIGITNPFAPLTIGSPAVAGSDGFLVISKNSNGNRNTKIGYDTDFNFCIGDFGGNVSGNSWRPTDFTINWNSGNVGIGTSGQSQRLNVNGTTYFNGNSTINANILNIAGSVPYLQLKSDNYNLGVSGGIGNFSSSSVANDMILRTIAGTNLYLQAGVAGHALKIDSANNVSIPNKLTISGEMNNAVNTWHKSSEGISRTYYDSNGTTFFQSGKTSGTGNAFSFQNRESTATIFSIDAAAGAIYIGSNLSNSFQLYISAPYLTLPAYIQTLKLSSPYTFNQYLAIQPLGGTTGIGTDSAYSTATKLTIKGGSTGYSQPLVRIEQTNAWDGNYVLETVGYTNLNGIRINGGDTNSIYKTAATGDMGLQVNNGNILFGNNGGERMRIDASGNIGIGTNNCSTKLHIEHSSTSFFASTGGLYLYNPNNASGHCSVLGARIAGSSANKVGISLDVQNIGGWSIYMNGNDSERWLRFNNSWSASLTEHLQIRGTDGQMNINGNAYMGANVNINNGTLSFGSRVQDYLIYLWGTTYGFGINGGTLRYNSASAHKFYAGSTNTATIDSAGNLSITGALSVGTTATISGLTRLRQIFNYGETLSYNPNFTGSSGWFWTTNHYWDGYGTASYLRIAITCSGIGGCYWYGRAYLSGGGGFYGVICDFRTPDNNNANQITVQDWWSSNGWNALRISIQNAVYAGTFNIKISA